MKTLTSALGFLLIASAQAQAVWTVQPDQSQVYFMSYKNVDIAESHVFKKVQGTVDAKGIAKITIQLASVDTKIPIRDERMKTLLFETDTHPSAEITAKLDPKWLAEVEKGTPKSTTLNATLKLHGQEKPIQLMVMATRTQNNQVQVTTMKPIILNAESWGLAKGITKLKDIAGLSSISISVPVGFVLNFASQE